MSRSSAAVKIQFHQGWEDPSVGGHRTACRACVPAASPSLGQSPGSCRRSQVLWSHRCGPPRSQLKQTLHFTRTQIGVFFCCSLQPPEPKGWGVPSLLR